MTTLPGQVYLDEATIRSGTIFSNAASAGQWGRVSLYNTGIVGTLVLSSEEVSPESRAFTDLVLAGGAQDQTGDPSLPYSTRLDLYNNSDITGSGSIIADGGQSIIRSIGVQNIIGPGIATEHQSGRLDLQSLSDGLVLIDGALVSDAADGLVLIDGALVNDGSIRAFNGVELRSLNEPFTNRGVVNASGEGTFVRFHNYGIEPGGLITTRRARRGARRA